VKLCDGLRPPFPPHRSLEVCSFPMQITKNSQTTHILTQSGRISCTTTKTRADKSRNSKLSSNASSLRKRHALTSLASQRVNRTSHSNVFGARCWKNTDKTDPTFLLPLFRLARLQRAYEQAVVNDWNVEDHDGESQMWKTCFYKPIEEWRRKIRTVRSSLQFHAPCVGMMSLSMEPNSLNLPS